MLNQLKIGLRLSILLAVMLGLLGFLAFTAMQGLDASRGDLQVTNEAKLKPTRLAGRIQRLVAQTQVQSLLALGTSQDSCRLIHATNRSMSSAWT